MRGTIFTAHSAVNEAQGLALLDQTNLALVVAGITFVTLAFVLIASLYEEKSYRRILVTEGIRRQRLELAI
jgi:hypothetical protein